MKFDPKLHHRRSTRLKGYDYAQPGAYFVTLCTWQRECIFGEVLEGDVHLTQVGKIVDAEWRRLAMQFPHIILDAFVIMPNHLHGIILINPTATSVGATHPTPSGGPVSDGPGTNDSPDTIAGSPCNANHVSPTPVGATHPMPGGAPVGDGPGTNDSAESTSGSPELGDKAPRGPHDGPNDPSLSTLLIPGIGATRRSPSNVPNIRRYNQTQSGDQLDGSPLRDISGLSTTPKGPAAGSLGTIIGQFKSRATKRIWTIPKYDHTPIWQRNYYEHIIRDHTEWHLIREYIHNNPFSWQDDHLHPLLKDNR